jgi:Protein of unknown function (DUF5818)
MRFIICFMAVAAATLVAGCRDEPTKVVPGQTVRIQGTLVAGAECATLVTKTGHRYSVGGDLGKFKLGDRVCVKGKFAEVSFCMAGEGTIAVEDIGPEGQCP